MSTRKQTAAAPAPAPSPAQPVDALAELGVPLTQRGMPDLLNAVPKRFVPLAEAQARGWSWHWTGAACRYSHMAARKTANPAVCSDCMRVKAGQPPIYPKSRAQSFYELKGTPSATPAGAPPGAAAPTALEPDPADKKFLAEYASHRELEKAAAAAGTTAALIAARRSHNPALDAAMTKLETDLMIPKHVPEPSIFEWTHDKRARLIESYIDSGNLAIARDAVKCTPSQLWRELDANPEFSMQLEAARPRAIAVLEEVATAQALAGNDKLVQLVLRAEKPEKYVETRQVNLSTNLSRLTDEQLDARLLDLLSRVPGLTIIDGEFTETSANANTIASQAPVPQLAAPEMPADFSNEDLT